MLDRTAKFECVVVDRDVTPDVPKRFGVTAYPTILILDPGARGIMRWSGFSSTPYLASQLDESLRRHELARREDAGEDVEPFDGPPARADAVSAVGTTRTIDAPEREGIVSGLAVGGGAIWVAEQGMLHRIDLEKADDPFSVESWQIPGMAFANGLALDGAKLYVLPYSWRGDATGIRVFDTKEKTFADDPIRPAAFTGRRSAPTTGIAVREGSLFVLQRTSVIEIDLESGEEKSRTTIELEGHKIFGTAGLHHDGEKITTTVWAQDLSKVDPGIRRMGILDKAAPFLRAILVVDPATGRATGQVPIEYHMRSMAVGEPGVYYMGEQPSWYHDRDHQRIRVPEGAPIHVLDARRRSGTEEE